MVDSLAETDRDVSPFLALDEALRSSGPEATIGRLIALLTERNDSRGLLDALLLKARHELGLPLIQAGSLLDLPEDVRDRYEERYVQAIREVGGRLLDAGDIPSAWPYFRAIAEPDRVKVAIARYEPGEADDRLGQIVEVAFNQGAHPEKGFALILEHYGTCSAISAFEHLPPDQATRAASAARLVRQVHEHLVASLRAEVAQRGQPLPPERTSIAGLIAGRDWLFGEDAYHIDVSHLAATVRVSPLVTDPDAIALAADLTEYGRNLSERHQYEGEPPFDRTYDDHRTYLHALLGQDVEAALAHFRAKLEPPDLDGREGSLPAQVLVGLLVRLGRIDEAIDLAGEYLAGYPDSSLICPGVAQLCQRAGQPGRLAKIALDHGDLVQYAASILQVGPPTLPPEPSPADAGRNPGSARTALATPSEDR